MPDVRDGTDRRIALLAVLSALLITAAYALARHLIRTIGSEQRLDWFQQDQLLCIPRALAGASALLAGTRFIGTERLGLRTWSGKRKIALTCSAFLVADLLYMFEPSTRPLLPELRIWIYFGLSSFIVAVFEELVFRGLLLKGLMTFVGPWWASVASASAFMAFHYEAQPMTVWPQIFMYGFVAALLRLEGVSLYWLIAMHWLLDSLNATRSGFIASFDAWYMAQLAVYVVWAARCAYTFKPNPET